jgi:tRNA pseudouridine32 synthase/23S rRNA pseudouridine746 synthase
VVVDKQPMVLSVPSRDRNEKRPVLGLQLQSFLRTQIYPVHRLDFEVSGLVLYAVNEQAQRIATAWFEGHTVYKTYQALTLKTCDFSHWPPQLEHAFPEKKDLQFPFTWKNKLLRGKRRAYASPHGKTSETRVLSRDLQKDESYSWKLQPITGRPHQLRYELSYHGFPITGDATYGSKREWPLGIALRAFQIDFSVIPDASRLGLPEFIQIAGLN